MGGTGSRTGGIPELVMLCVCGLGVAGCGLDAGDPGFGDSGNETSDGDDTAAGNGTPTPGPTGPLYIDGTGEVYSELKAVAWDDNLHWDGYLEYQALRYPGTYHWGVSDRTVVTVVDALGRPVRDALVSVYRGSSSSPLLAGRSTSDGRMLIHPSSLGVTDASSDETLFLTAAKETDSTTGEVRIGGSATLTLSNPPPASLQVDLAFCLDTTGSMQDEADYLEDALQDIVARVVADNYMVDVRLGLVEYRDQGDAYVTRVTDFTTHVEDYVATLEAVTADGGGDIPEDLNSGLYDSLNSLTWLEDNAVKLLFLITDASAHTDYLETNGYDESVITAVEKGVRIYPVLASGGDSTAEYTLRQLAQYTLGQYIFITPFYGLDESLYTPDSYVVEYLNDVIVRIVDSELAGEYPATPIP